MGVVGSVASAFCGLGDLARVLRSAAACWRWTMYFEALFQKKIKKIVEEWTLFYNFFKLGKPSFPEFTMVKMQIIRQV